MYNAMVEENTTLQRSVQEAAVWKAQLEALERSNQAFQDQVDLAENTSCNLKGIINENEVMIYDAHLLNYLSR